jgi:hypothetical protein
VPSLKLRESHFETLEVKGNNFSRRLDRCILVLAGVLIMRQNFAVIILGGTGQVGGAAVAELLAIPECREVVMVTRKPIARRLLLSVELPAGPHSLPGGLI